MDETDLDVPECLVKVRQGDQSAASELVRFLYPLVIKIVRAHLPKHVTDEDLAQTVFMKIFSKLDQYSGAAPFQHWVSRIAVNTCYHQLDRERVRQELRMSDLSEEQEQVIENLASTESELPASQAVASRDLVEQLLGSLNPQDRLIITLMHMEGRTIAEVKEITGWNTPVIKVRAFRARQKLKKQLNRLLKENTNES